MRGGLFDLSILPNNIQLDPHFPQFQWVGEIERRYTLWEHPGKIAVTGYLSRARMGSYADAIALAAMTGGPADISAVRQYRSRGGVSMKIEQEISSDLGAFVRAGAANATSSPTSSVTSTARWRPGLRSRGRDGGGRTTRSDWPAWSTEFPASTKPSSMPVGSVSSSAMANCRIPVSNRSSRRITNSPIGQWGVTFDYQFIVNPAYNRDRGPVSVLGMRLHAQF